MIVDKTEMCPKVGDTRFHYGRDIREICISDGKLGNSSVYLDGETWVDYNSEEGVPFHYSSLENLLEIHYSLSLTQLIEMLKIQYPEKLL